MEDPLKPWYTMQRASVVVLTTCRDPLDCPHGLGFILKTYEPKPRTHFHMSAVVGGGALAWFLARELCPGGLWVGFMLKFHDLKSETTLTRATGEAHPSSEPKP